MSDLTLVILAAGLGSRYGGVKQLEGLGPSNEVLLDYSVYDAIRSGFGKVVIVIREEMEAAFRERITQRFEKRVTVKFVYQTLDKAPESRVKPLGTGHALLAAADSFDGPFAAINADDFYGPTSFRLLAQRLGGISAKSGVLIGFELDKTLSDFGSVSRAVCEASSDKLLTRIEEHTQISRREGGITGVFNGTVRNLKEDTIVSLNLWGFSPDFLPFLAKQFDVFIKELSDPLTEEFYLPAAVFEWIRSEGAAVELSLSSEKWLGLTNPQDKVDAKAQLSDLIAQGIYPTNLWD
ncbi:MAG: NTP transferase domain-containing protein [Verrucomicrobia bacterium]|nr:NTP transferase domain-containing protein [Verrucomicrobiota bacterium]MDA1067164.1 NTP transferase domain-containing protein [Verrucomicrobiota bacterium]